MFTYSYHILATACWSPSVLEQLEGAREFLDIKDDFKEECWLVMHDSPKDCAELYRDCVDTVQILEDMEDLAVRDKVAEYQLLAKTVDILLPFFTNWWRDLQHLSCHYA